MTPPVLAADGTMRAYCNDCEWTFERSLEAGDLLIDENKEIAARVVRSHAYTCDSTGDEWGETADVELDLAGGV